MQKRGDRILPEGTVIAIDPDENGFGATFTVETNERVNTRMSGAAQGYEGVQQAQPLRQERVRVTGRRWDEIKRRGTDEWLARTVVIADITEEGA